MEKLKIAEDISTLPLEVKRDILAKYDTLASVHFGVSSEKVIENNRDTYETILQPMVYRSLLMDQSSDYFIKAKGDSTNIARLFSNSEQAEKIFKEYRNKLGVQSIEIDREKIVKALSGFGIETVSDSEIENIAKEVDFEFSDEDLIDVSFDDFLEDDLLDDLEFSEDSLFGKNGKSEEPKEEEVQSYEEPEDNQESTEDEDYSRIMSVWGDDIKITVNGIMETYDRLYQSGYGLVMPSGVLTNEGIKRSNSKGELGFSGSRATDIKVFQAISDALGEANTYQSFTSEEPDIRRLYSSKTGIVFTDMHIKFMFGHLNFAKGKHGIRRYLTRTGKTNESETKVIKYSDIRGWIQEEVERYICKAYKDMGFSDEITEEKLQESLRINKTMSSYLKNVIIVAERKAGVNTRIKISCDKPINDQLLVRKLTSSLNVGQSRNVKVRTVGEYKNGIIDINIVYNDKAYSQDTLFGYQVLDVFEEQGLRPSWSNVIMGKKDDGTIYTRNFKSTNNPVYALYASSGGGKGVMTLNLLVTALVDGCDVWYIDGKPDVAKTLADVAWTRGKEAMVYNGVQSAGAMLEHVDYCPRKSKAMINGNPKAKSDLEVALDDYENIPKGIFKSKADALGYIMLTTYLRGLELLTITAKQRTETKPSDWLVVVLDEMKNAAEKEKLINEKLESVLTARKKEVGPDGKKIQEATDPVCQFINRFNRWKNEIVGAFIECITATFRFADMTVICVWQETDFPKDYVSVSSIAKAVDSASSKFIKIMGARAAKDYGSTNFGTPSSLSKTASWYDYRFTEPDKGGHFAIGINVNSNDMVTFRPFNVYSDAKHPELIVQNAEAVGMTKQDLVGVSFDENGQIIHEVGFEGYADAMLNRFGLKTEEQLQKGFDYANQVLQNEGLNININDYMYNVHNFDLIYEGADNMGAGGYDPVDSSDNTKPVDNLNKQKLDYIDDDEVLEFGNTAEASPWDDSFIQQVDNRTAETMNKQLESIKQFKELGRQTNNKAQPNVEMLDWGEINNQSEQEQFMELEYEVEEPDFEDDNYVPIYNTRASSELDFEDDNYVPIYNTRASSEPQYNPNYADSTFTRGENGRVNVRPRETQNIIPIRYEESMDIPIDRYSPIIRFKEKLFQSQYGTVYQFSKRWKAVLDNIKANYPSASMITRVTIADDTLMVNNKIIDMSDILDGEYDVRFEDIVNFKVMFKKFPGIKELMLDRDAFDLLTDEYGRKDTDIWQVFLDNKALAMMVIEPLSGGNPTVVYRDKFADKVEEIKRKAEESKFRREIDYMSAANNPRLNEKSIGYQSKVWNGSKNTAGKAWKNARKSMTQKGNTKWFKAAGFSLGAAALILGGGLVGGLEGIINKFSRR